MFSGDLHSQASGLAPAFIECQFEEGESAKNDIARLCLYILPCRLLMLYAMREDKAQTSLHPLWLQHDACVWIGSTFIIILLRVILPKSCVSGMRPAQTEPCMNRAYLQKQLKHMERWSVWCKLL